MFVIYVFVAARPIPKESIISPRWITSLESNYPVSLGEYSGSGGNNMKFLPFRLGERYGYVGDNGLFSINNVRNGYVSISQNIWAEYETQPSSIKVNNQANELLLVIEDPRGYPLFIDDRIFVIGVEQNSISSIGSKGELLWVYDFPAPVTCFDAAGGFVLAGTLDGAVILLDSSGTPVFTPFEPGGSRLAVILGCALSSNGSMLAIIAGIDNQRFLVMEQFGETYRVVYHEFLTEGFRRPVHISFVDNDNRIAFEREGGLGIYDIYNRLSATLNLEGDIIYLDDSGFDQFLYIITSLGPAQKRFIAVSYPGVIAINTPFKSNNIFFARQGSSLFLGGDNAMVSLEIEKK